MRKIATDKFGADLAAEAARMLKPDRLPQPPKPLTTPRAKFLKPRKPKEFDLGVRPTKGVMASSAGAWMGAASNLATGIAGAATSGSKNNFNLKGPAPATGGLGNISGLTKLQAIGSLNNI
jgi:hypothetical protein